LRESSALLVGAVGACFFGGIKASNYTFSTQLAKPICVTSTVPEAYHYDWLLLIVLTQLFCVVAAKKLRGGELEGCQW
jgi:hypothetical protein